MTRGDCDMNHENPYIKGCTWPELNIVEMCIRDRYIFVSLVTDANTKRNVNGM